MVAATPKKGKKTASPSPTPAIAVATPTPEPIATPEPTATPLIVKMTPPPAPSPAAAATTPPSFAQNIASAPVPLATASSMPPAPGQTPFPANPEATPEPQPAAPPVTTGTTAASNPNVPLQPFLEAKATPALTTTVGSWKTYRPGQMPRGRLLKVTDATDLANKGGTGGERLYLSGQFVVTASGDNRAVLRSKGGILNTLNPLGGPANGNARILVEFPAGSVPPSEGATVSRDEMRPFEIRDVQRAKDGTINVFVREVTSE
jgi:hypothetical protein